jgi:hypothetical protein
LHYNAVDGDCAMPVAKTKLKPKFGVGRRPCQRRSKIASLSGAKMHQ